MIKCMYTYKCIYIMIKCIHISIYNIVFIYIYISIYMYGYMNIYVYL